MCLKCALNLTQTSFLAVPAVQEAAEKQRQRQLDQEQQEMMERPWLARRLQEQQQQQQQQEQEQQNKVDHQHP
jgi:hypothetical protein